MGYWRYDDRDHGVFSKDQTNKAAYSVVVFVGYFAGRITVGTTTKLLWDMSELERKMNL